jgi:Inner membrane protein CreD
MSNRLLAIGGIFLGASLAWLILGSTLAQRTDDSDQSQQSQLSSQWGSALVQNQPSITVARGPNGTNAIDVPISSTRVLVNMRLEQRQKGLLWYDLYDVDFSARYIIRNPAGSRTMFVNYTLPEKNATYANFALSVNGHKVDNAHAFGGGDQGVAVSPGHTTTVDVTYTTRGMDSWKYSFGSSVSSLNDFELTMTTDFKAIGFPDHTLLPTSETPAGSGWQLTWKYGSLVTGDSIGMAIPSPLQPGPLAQRITFWAPVSLLFYVFVMLLITTLRKIDLHPMNYFFLAAAFFAFHLLFAYLVDRIPLGVAFVICSLVSMGLTISYLRLVVGMRFAAVEGGVAQLLYLVLFSYALFNEGWSGLTITIGAIITLFAAMQLTGRIRWSERFAR